MEIPPVIFPYFDMSPVCLLGFFEILNLYVLFNLNSDPYRDVVRLFWVATQTLCCFFLIQEAI